MSTNIETAMIVSGLERPELILMCTYCVRSGLAKSPVDAINKFAEGILTANDVSDHAAKKAIPEQELDWED